jgi:hypothetical protein
MTLEQATAASRIGNVKRYRNGTLLLVNRSRNLAHLVFAMHDDTGEVDFEETTVTPEEMAMTDWQPEIDGDDEDESDVPSLCSQCAVKPARYRCGGCGQLCCESCIYGEHRDGPNICPGPERLGKGASG